MRHIARPHKMWFFGVLIAVITAEFLGTSMPYIFKSLIDTAEKISLGSASVHDLWLWAGAYPVAVLFMFGAWRVSGFIGMEWASRASATSYTTLFSYLTHHSHAYFSDRFAGSLSSKISHASDGIQSLFESFIWNYVPSALSLVVTVGYMYMSSPMVAFMFALLIAVLVPFNIILARKRRPLVVSFSAQATKARGYAVDAITNMAAIRQYARVEDEQQEFNAHICENA